MTQQQSEPVSVMMSAIGGYGYYYMKTLLEEFPPGSVIISGVIDPFAEKSAHYPEINKREIQVFARIEDFYKGGHSTDLAVISSPLHFHIPQSCVALHNGSNVLCDKPASVLVQDIDKLIATRDAASKWVMVGYQWSYSKAIQSLKRDSMRGAFGRPLRLKTLCYWRRDDAYYRRNDWAGKVRNAGGRWILDSPVSNAMAHFIHNMFYVLGKETHLSAAPKEVIAELYRANRIENYDTAACRIYTDEGAELLFYGSHATSADRGPMFNYEFEDAVVSFNESTDSIIATDRKGNRKDYGSPDDDHQFQKLFEAVESCRIPTPIVCGPEAVRSHILCMNGMQESVPAITDFPRTMIQRDDEAKRWWVQGLDEAFLYCYNNGILPNEAKFSWAKQGVTFDLRGYLSFPSNAWKD